MITEGIYFDLIFNFFYWRLYIKVCKHLKEIKRIYKVLHYGYDEQTKLLNTYHGENSYSQMETDCAMFDNFNHIFTDLDQYSHTDNL